MPDQPIYPRLIYAAPILTSMAPGQTDPDFIDAERARFSKKLDGYETMGLEVTALRQLLDEDLERFRDTYLGEIRTQLDGGGEEEPEPEPGGGTEPGSEPEPEISEELAQEEADEELELQLEGAGPEEALMASEGPDDLDEVVDEEIEAGVTSEEAPLEDEVEISIDEEPVPVGETAAAEPKPDGMVEDGPDAVEPLETGEEETSEDAGEAEIEVTPEAIPEVEPEEEAEEEEEAQIEVGPEEILEEEPLEETEEALIVVAAAGAGGEEEEETLGAEAESEILLSGIGQAGRTEEEPEDGPEPKDEPEAVEEPAEEEPLKEEEKPSKAAAPRPKKVVPVAKARPPSKPKTATKAKAQAKAQAKAKTKVKPAPKTVKRRRGLSKGVLAVVVAAIVVLASIGSYFIFFQNEDPVALFEWDLEEPAAGEVIGFDARSSSDPDDDTIVEYRWKFGDGASGKGRYVEHSYVSSETFTVSLTVKDARGGESTTHRKVTVEPLTISMEQPHVGDLFIYGIDGDAKLYNYADGLITFKYANREYKVFKVDATDISGTKTFEVTQSRTAPDGFMQNHDVRVETSVYDINDISGIISTETAANPSFSGSILASMEEDVCLEWERVVRTTVSIQTGFNAPLWGTLDTDDSGTFYAQLNGIADTFSLEEFLRTESFSSEDRDVHDIGTTGYNWQVRGMERVEGRTVPSIHIWVTMDQQTQEDSDLVDFLTEVWLEPGLSQPAQNHIFVKGQQEGNNFEVNLTETLTSVSLGSDDATGPCGADHGYSEAEENPESFIPLDRVPEQGGAFDHFKFSPEEALIIARAETPDFNSWMINHQDAFSHLGNYSENEAGEGTWVLNFGQLDLTDHYKIDAIGVGMTDISTKAKSYPDDKLPLSSPEEIGDIVTLTHGLRLMREEPNIKNRCFDGLTPDWTLYRFNITEGVTSLSLDPASALAGSQETGYVYLLVSKKDNPRYQAALDATNGQILFSWTHSQNFDPLGG